MFLVGCCMIRCWSLYFFFVNLIRHPKQLDGVPPRTPPPTCLCSNIHHTASANCENSSRIVTLKSSYPIGLVVRTAQEFLNQTGFLGKSQPLKLIIIFIAKLGPFWHLDYCNSLSDNDSTDLQKRYSGLFTVTLISFFDSFARLLAPAMVQVFKMVSQFNSYRNFIDIKTKEGQTALANAIDKFVSPLSRDNHLLLVL